MASFKLKIDQLPEEEIEAAGPREAAHKVTALIEGHESLRKLADDEPVQIKRPDRSPWGRHLTLGDFRHGEIAAEGDDAEGPVRPASPSA